MFISENYVYGGKIDNDIRISEVKPLKDKMMLLKFVSGEEKLFDATILNGEAFEPLNDEKVFENAKIEHGVVTWLNGELDCSPEFMYNNSYEYSVAV